MPYPSNRQWELFERYQTCPPPLHPGQFQQHWDLSYGELAKIAKTSRSTVEHWFLVGASRREPTDHHCRRLAEVHLVWSQVDRFTPGVIAIWCQPPFSPNGRGFGTNF